MYEDLEFAIAEIQQPRSRFQLECFVLKQHATVEMQYVQTLLELQNLLHSQKITLLKIRKAEIEIAKLRESTDEVDLIEAEIQELELKQTRLTLIGAEREIGHLVEIWQAFPHKFTRKEIEAAQPDYWKARLIGNAEAMLLGGQGVNPAHIEAMAQAGVLDEYKTAKLAEINKLAEVSANEIR